MMRSHNTCVQCTAIGTSTFTGRFYTKSKDDPCRGSKYASYQFK